ncbi:TetR/AcrR family transcriptional regulator [Ciceribacter ferrooxidans]
MFRENGIAATAVADVMKAAGLTHGGFYRHFASKDNLVAAAISHAVSTLLIDLKKAKGHEAKTNAVLSYIDRYLSDEHVGNPATAAACRARSRSTTFVTPDFECARRR